MRYAHKYDQVSADWIGPASLAAVGVVDRIKREQSDWSPENTVASLLVDHSGSLRGQRAILACATVEIVADMFSRLGIAYEILGFTTRSWRGGNSRRDWRFWWRRPRKPGRLCDLLHIVYREAGTTQPGAPWTIRNLLRHNLLKENVDGEALLWAAERLTARPENDRCILVISDGAPADDATLLANGPDILQDHLKSVISELTERRHMSIGAIGIDYDVSEYYDTCIQLSSTGELGERLLQFVGNLVTRRRG